MDAVFICAEREGILTKTQWGGCCGDAMGTGPAFSNLYSPLQNNLCVLSVTVVYCVVGVGMNPGRAALGGSGKVVTFIGL